MTNFTPEEQLYLELINRARLDPNAEASRPGIDLANLNQFIPGGTLTGDPKQPLAGNDTLTSLARSHSQAVKSSGAWNGSDPHNLAGDGSLSDRFNNSPFPKEGPRWGFGENIAVTPLTGTTTDHVVSNNNGLFRDDPAVFHGSPGGHRINMLNTDFREVGIGVADGFSSNGNYSIVTQEFAFSGAKSFLTGAVYNDTNGDHFYGVGEGVNNVTVSVKLAGASVGSDSTGTLGGGGWSVGEPGKAGDKFDVTFSGAGLGSGITATVESGALNAKVDLVNSHEIDVSANATLGAGAVDLRLLGVGNLNGTGNADDNHLIGNHGNNILDGNAGDDTAVYDGRSSDYRVTKLVDGSFQVVDLRAGSIDGTDVLKNIEHIQFLGDGRIQDLVAAPPPPPAITGTDAADTLHGTSGVDVMLGLGGNDTLLGSAGADRLDGGAGFDTASYAASSEAVSINLATGVNHGGDAEGDTLISIERVIGSAFNDTYVGSAGNDSFTGGAGADHIDGGAGFDTASYATSSAGVSIDLSTGIGHFGDAEGDTLINIERVIGSAFNDKLVGSAHNDSLYGGAGGDLLIGGAGADHLDGGSGIDTASYATSVAGVSINLGTGIGHGGDAEGDTLVNIERVIGSDFADTLIGSAGDDTLIGHGGADFLDGGAGFDTANYAASLAAVTVNLATGKGSGGDAAGDTLISIEHVIGSAFNDKLTGGAANETLEGGAGNDTINGGAGKDILTGGLGNDTFLFVKGQANGDIITDFNGNGAGVGDQLKFSGYGAGASFHATATPDQFQIDYNGGTQHETITLANHATVHASDVVFV